MSKHTPGPWKVKRGNSGERAPFIVCTFGSNTGEDYNIVAKQPVHGNEKDDARLIAAAPDLLAACEAAKKHLEPDLVEPGRTVFWNLVEAISKAKGPL